MTIATQADEKETLYDAVIFDLLTALIDSWTLWNNIAGSDVDGLRWRKEYLRLTYGAGTYRDYTSIVAQAAQAAGLSSDCATELEAQWNALTAWPEASATLKALGKHSKLAIVTNCSKELGQQAARCVYKNFDVIMTAQDAGFYKPHREPYARTLAALATSPQRTLYVAGSPADIPGASALGMPVYWHNRIGLPPIGNVVPNFLEPSLAPLVKIVNGR